jgi:Flp pilus assembly pilin Flp
MVRKNKGQSTLEYVAVFAAIVAAIVVFAWSQLNPAVQSVMDSSATKITTATTDFNK